MNFQEYLISKKIDAKVFQATEPLVFEAWQKDFEQMHPNSFTVQKLNLINPIRRKYPLPVEVVSKPEVTPEIKADSPPVATPSTAPKVARPMMRPKPKMN